MNCVEIYDKTQTFTQTYKINLQMYVCRYGDIIKNNVFFFSFLIFVSLSLQSPKYAPPIEFVDEAALSPPDGYKDNGLKNTLGGALSGHIFGAQHLQQLQVIQRLQQQRAAMLAARNNSQIPPPPPPAQANSASAASVNQQQSSTASSSSTSSSSSTPSTTATTAVATTVASNNSINQNAATQQQHSPDDDTQGVCTECAECAECAAKQLQQDAGKLYFHYNFNGFFGRKIILK